MSNGIVAARTMIRFRASRLVGAGVICIALVLGLSMSITVGVLPPTRYCEAA